MALAEFTVVERRYKEGRDLKSQIRSGEIRNEGLEGEPAVSYICVDRKKERKKERKEDD